MSLKTYRRKRRFDATPEPRGQAQDDGGSLRFVVQKHQASRLHYDFRLEMDGVLKSWAVPKGPSLDPADKRLAVMVEDHPLEYRTFEGVIPEGNYGAGTVIVWDEGSARAPGIRGRQESEAALKEGLARGRLSFILDGSRLRGEFALVKLKRGKANNWLMIKKRDQFATEEDVTAEDRSVHSGLTLNDVAAGAKSPKAPRALKRSSRSNVRRAKRSPRTAPRGTARAKMPHDVHPMLATLVDAPFDRSGWLFEPKWDGYRAIAEVAGSDIRLYSRNHKTFNDRFAPVVESLRRLGHDAVLDGEIVVIDKTGKSDFQLLQNYQKTGKGRLVYYVFDLLYLDGEDLRALPLTRRKKLLQGILGDLSYVRFSEHVQRRGSRFFQAAIAAGLEGIIAKDGAGPYREGVRSQQWLKLKTRRRQEAVIAGFTEPRGSRQGLGALVLGVYEGSQLVYIGHTGGGFGDQSLAEMHSRLEPLVRRRCPFQEKPTTNAPVHWVEPRLVCEVAFQEWTQDGRMRQPIFVGLREDKPAAEVHRETAHAASEVVSEAEQKPKRSAGRAALNSPSTSEVPTLTNLDKIYWPDEGFTKGDVIGYYRDVAPVILPYLRDRPLTLHRHPNGIRGKSFFQRDVSHQLPPPWVQTVVIRPESGKKAITSLVCQNEATLLYVANLGCIELNPWNARVASLEHPDYLIVDLDPEDAAFGSVVKVAQAVRKVFEDTGAACYCKTSGKRGLHVCVPLGAAYQHDQARQFAEIVARIVNQQLPDLTSLVRSPALRQHRVYLDYLQNRRGQTLAAPYSVRPVAAATVSTPLRWSEVKANLDPSAFTIRTIAKRINRVGDLWTPVLGRGIDLEQCVRRLSLPFPAPSM